MSVLKAKQTQVIKDRLICFDVDQKTVEILTVDEQDGESIKAGGKTFARADLSLSLSKQGRVFVFQAPTNVIQQCENLARLERNTIIRQIAQYRNPVEEHRGLDIKTIVMIAGLILVAIVAIATR
jgi:hypothetical protein